MKISCFILILAVIFGAFGAHTLEKYLEPSQLKSWHTAVEYQFYHGLGLLGISLIPSHYIARFNRLKAASIFMIIGIVLFSGSIFVLATKTITGIPSGIFGPLTPLGGLCFLTAWILVLLSLKKRIAEKGGEIHTI